MFLRWEDERLGPCRATTMGGKGVEKGDERACARGGRLEGAAGAVTVCDRNGRA